MNKFDVIIIGAGSAGLSALREVRKYTNNFILINDGPWGTTCARVGCMPSKVLIEAANAFHRRLSFEEFGIFGAEHLELDDKRVLQRVRKLRDFFVSSTLKTVNELGERAISGRAKLLSPNEITVNGQQLSACKIIIATGSRPVVPSGWKSLGKRLLTTDTLFEQEEFPKRMAVIGMGPVGLEMAQALSRLGVEVSGFNADTMIGGISDAVINQAATELISNEFKLYLGERADVMTDSANKELIKVRAGATEIEVDSVLAALGRRPNIDDIGLETLGIPLDDQGLPSFNPNTLQLEDLPVYLAGDANQYLPLLHEVADEGHIAGLSAVREEPICFKRQRHWRLYFLIPILQLWDRFFIHWILRIYKLAK